MPSQGFAFSENLRVLGSLRGFNGLGNAWGLAGFLVYVKHISMITL